MIDDEDNMNIGTPSYEWWAEAFKDEKFKEMIMSKPVPPGIIPPWDPIWENKND